MKLSAAERQAYERYSDDLHYQASMLDSSYGLGKIEGREEGREEGRGEGREEGIVQVAKNLLQMGQSIENVSKATGLTPERIKKLADQNRVAEPATPYGLARPARKPRKSSKAK